MPCCIKAKMLNIQQNQALKALFKNRLYVQSFFPVTPVSAYGTAAHYVGFQNDSQT